MIRYIYTKRESERERERPLVNPLEETPPPRKEPDFWSTRPPATPRPLWPVIHGETGAALHLLNCFEVR